MSKKKDCFGKYAVRGNAPVQEKTTTRVRSKSSETYTCRTEECPYMKDCIMASLYSKPEDNYKKKEARRNIESSNLTGVKDLSTIVL